MRMNRNVTTIIIGAGHAGLAMSRCLTERSIDHVVLERGEVANSWKTERWDSLRLLTPNWLSRLPGYRYKGDDPDGYRTMPETVAFLEWYAQRVCAPVRTHTAVTRVRRTETGYSVMTDGGEWRSKALVLASLSVSAASRSCSRGSAEVPTCRACGNRSRQSRTRIFRFSTSMATGTSEGGGMSSASCGSSLPRSSITTDF